MIYLDNAATTFPKPEEVYEAIEKANRSAFNSGRGSYKTAHKKNNIIDQTRKNLLELDNLKEGQVVFSSSATVSLNSLIFGLDLKENDYVYVSPFEHNSIIRPLEELKKRKGINIEYIPFKKETWELEEEKLSNLFVTKKPKAVFVSQISNVTGYVLPYEKIFELSIKYNAINILDAAQGYGIISILENNINYIVFAGHKSLYSVFGVAGYIKLKPNKLKQTIFGGTGSDTMNSQMPDTYPNGYEAGSHNIVAIESLNASINWLQKNNVQTRKKDLTKYLIKELKKIKKINLYLPLIEDNIFGIVSFNIEGYFAEDIGKILDEEFDIAVRVGFHCSPHVHKFIESEKYNGTVRISLGYFNTIKEIDKLILALESL